MSKSFESQFNRDKIKSQSLNIHQEFNKMLQILSKQKDEKKLEKQE